MTISELLAEYGAAGGICLVVILSLVEISPIKINPWSKLFRSLGKALNKDMLDEINALKTEVSDLKDEIKKVDDRVDKMDSRIDENNAIQCRSRILRFGDEVSHGQNHSRDHFKQIFCDITTYNSYCHSHPEFQNDMTKITSKRIEDDYMERDKRDTFL